MVTKRDIEVLCAFVRYYVLNRPLIQRLCFPKDRNGRVTRRRLQALVTQKLLNRGNLVVHHPQAGSPGPVYYPARRGIEFLAAHFDDERYLTVPTKAPQPHHVFHWLSVSETHIALERAIKRQGDVTLSGWLNEWDTVNKDEQRPERRFRLYTLIRENPRLVCAPDAAFLLSLGGHKKVFYVEQDRNTSGVARIAASKTPGYVALAQQQLHVRHFSDVTVPTFTVLCVAPTNRRRDALRNALREKPGAELWKFVTAKDLSREDFLSAPVLFPCVGEPAPLVKPLPSS